MTIGKRPISSGVVDRRLILVSVRFHGAVPFRCEGGLAISCDGHRGRRLCGHVMGLEGNDFCGFNEASEKKRMITGFIPSYQIFKGIEGLSQRQIAKQLGISRNTVRKHLSNQTAPTVIHRTKENSAGESPFLPPIFIHLWK
ncbi:sigma factor-like helix-turn-helix DNA-binding protein [Thermicanus aegyptius]|uniref:sigma factor-like helix-turn-helix DNA-binding protein n=1 Tax=Thermicanus aegyptius TaxID=94009 RepID=UPI00146FA8B7|nr:sigma factor-like helix-turn-helix DNA-binding protein [Thermicanus aegyptius]